TKVEYKTINKFILTVKLKKKLAKHLENARIKIKTRKENNDSVSDKISNEKSNDLKQESIIPNESDFPLLRTYSSEITHVSNSDDSSASFKGTDERVSNYDSSPKLSSKYSSIFIKVNSDDEVSDSDSDSESILQIPGCLE